MIRQRQVQSLSYSSGATMVVDLPRDAVFHWLTLQVKAGSLVSVQGAMGTGGTFESNFPFSLMRNIRLIRNGSDVVWQGSGAQLAKEHYYLNRSAPFARIYTVSANVETLRTGTVRGITIPANPDGINANYNVFTVPDAAASSATVNFDFSVDLILQQASDDAYFATLLDARPLATYQLEVTWATDTQIIIPGTANTSNTFSFTMNILSVDQDNVQTGLAFGTLKRSAVSYSNFAFGSSNQQVLLNRGNYFQGLILQTRAFKAASTSILAPENNVLSTIQNRINTNYTLHQMSFQQLQQKNVADYGGRAQTYATAGGMPQGFAYLFFPVAGDRSKELVPTYAMDVFDLLLTYNAIGSAENGVTTASTLPTLDILSQEVIPGVDVGGAAPRAAQAGSVGRVSAGTYG